MPDLIVNIDCPPSSIGPNRSRKGSWRPLHEGIKEYRRLCGDLAWLARRDAELENPWTVAAVQAFRWYGGKNKKQDPDNLIASLKPAFDGLVDANILTDDRDIILLPPVQEAGETRIELHLWGSDGWLDRLIEHLKNSYHFDPNSN